MRLRFLALFAIAALFLAKPAMSEEMPNLRPVTTGMAERLSEAAAAFADAASRLHRTMDAACAARDPRVALQPELARTVEAWGRLIVLRLAPVTDAARLERVLFSPDPRDVTGRQLSALLAAEDEATFEALPGKSVALRGLGALDRMSDRLKEPYACRLAQAIAGEVAATAREIEAAATAFAQRLTDPGGEPYRTQAEAASAILNALATSTGALRDLTLRPILGDDPATSRWRQAPLRRTELTSTYIRAQIAGLTAAIGALNLGEALPNTDARLANQIAFELATAARALNGLDGPLEERVSDGATRGRLNLAVINLASLEGLLTERLAGALSLRLGFNSLDGD
ncbi:MAG: imelysin family protein [Pseudomonadota bacterium]